MTAYGGDLMPAAASKAPQDASVQHYGDLQPLTTVGIGVKTTAPYAPKTTTKPKTP